MISRQYVWHRDCESLLCSMRPVAGSKSVHVPFLWILLPASKSLEKVIRIVLKIFLSFTFVPPTIKKIARSVYGSEGGTKGVDSAGKTRYLMHLGCSSAGV